MIQPQWSSLLFHFHIIENAVSFAKSRHHHHHLPHTRACQTPGEKTSGKWESLRGVRLFATPWTISHQAPWNSPDKNTAVGSHPLLQGIFQTQGMNLGLPHCSLPSGLPGKPLLMFKAQLEVLSCVPSSSSLPPLKCPIYSTSSLSRPFASTQSQCMLLLFLLKIYILPKARPVARDTSMNSTIKVVIIIELTLARGQDSLPQDIPHWHIILHWSHSWCGATCFINKTAAQQQYSGPLLSPESRK